MNCRNTLLYSYATSLAHYTPFLTSHIAAYCNGSCIHSCQLNKAKKALQTAPTNTVLLEDGVTNGSPPAPVKPTNS